MSWVLTALNETIHDWDPSYPAGSLPLFSNQVQYDPAECDSILATLKVCNANHGETCCGILCPT
jgi:hypothetical protein